MECLTEFTCSVYADGELPETELRQIEEHLDACASCRGMASAYREENRLLVHCFQDIDWQEQPAASGAPQHVAHVAPAARPADVAKVGGMLVGVAALVRLAMSSPDDFVLPSVPMNLDWLDPSKVTGSLNWLGSVVSFGVSEGVSTMTSLVDGLSVAFLFVLILVGAVTLVRRPNARSAMMSTLATLSIILLFVAYSSSSYAMDVRTPGKGKVVVIPAGQVIDDSVFAAGDAVTIDGTVNGDLITFARQVTIHGAVNGNIITAGQAIDIQGPVGGSVIAAGNSIEIGDKVIHNVLGFGQRVTLGKAASVGGDLAAFGSELHVNGSLAHNFYAFGIADIAGSIGRNVQFRGDTISVLPSAHIGGDLTAHVRKEDSVRIDSGATIGGRQTVDILKPAPSKYRSVGFYFSAVLRLAAAFITGFILLLVFPRLRHASFGEVVPVLKSAGIGFLAIVAMPIAAIIVAITLIGIPVALVGIVAWVLGLYLAKIVVANFVGRTLLSSESHSLSSLALQLFVGLLLLYIAINLPYIGGLLHSFLILIGFGALVINVVDAFRPMDFAAGSGK